MIRGEKVKEGRNWLMDMCIISGSFGFHCYFYWWVHFIVFRVFDCLVDVVGNDDIHPYQGRSNHPNYFHHFTHIRSILHVLIGKPNKQHRNNNDKKACDEEVSEDFLRCEYQVQTTYNLLYIRYGWFPSFYCIVVCCL
jgi:hypothetical protein